MDNIKTGALIKELRQAKSMTQKELAELLHITDKAVSKWERGLCAPDISLLEPLAKILGTSISELIWGERVIMNEHAGEIEATAKSVLDYSKNEIVYKTKSIKKKYLITTAICIVLAILTCLFPLWQMGYFSIIDKSVSPDRNTKVTIYDRDIFSKNFSRETAIAVLVKEQDKGDLRITYGNCIYQGLWWAPDSKKYVIALNYDDGIYLSLAWLDRNVESNLNAYLSMGVEMNELAKYGLKYNSKSPLPEIRYQFLQWSIDSKSLLIYYSFADVTQEKHEGYFWYNCEDGTVTATLELQPQTP